MFRKTKPISSISLTLFNLLHALNFGILLTSELKYNINTKGYGSQKKTTGKGIPYISPGFL